MEGRTRIHIQRLVLAVVSGRIKQIKAKQQEQIQHAFRKCTSLSSCCTFCGLTTHVTFPLLLLSFSTLIFGYFHLQYPTPQHLKHYTPSSTVFCFLTSTSSFTPHCITLLTITSNLFWGTSFPFASFFLFLQLWARCLNFLYSQYILPSLSFISALSLVRAYC